MKHGLISVAGWAALACWAAAIILDVAGNSLQPGQPLSPWAAGFDGAAFSLLAAML